MTDVYTYIKKRNEINKPPNFTDSKTNIKIGIIPDEELDKINLDQLHSIRNPNQKTLSNFPQMTENIVNTERISTQDQLIYHFEGGWPKEVDITDPLEQRKYKKKKLEKGADNQDKFTPAVRKMIDVIEKVLSQNNEINMYEEYFDGEEPEHNIENINVKTLKLFKNIDDGPKRTVTSLSWHPDGPYKIAASYSLMKFQPQCSNYSQKSFIWDINNPNVPCETITPPSSIIKLCYNHKNIEQLAFGCYTGLVGLWDLRQNRNKPALTSEIENSHHEPVFDLLWLSSKGGNEFVSTSTDGTVFWWDSRNLSTSSDSLIIKENVSDAKGKIIGGTSLEYVADYGPKYLIGTELGSILLATKKPKKSVEINFSNSYGLQKGRHLGPIYRIQRNPFNPRLFMSIGDWSVNVNQKGLGR